MQNITMRDAFFNKLYEIAKKDRNVIVISADMGAPALDKFKANLSSQFINVGIAEGNMVTVAAGLALSGKKVFIYAIMPFVTSRCYEMIKVDLSLMNIPVTVVGVGAGFSYDDSGPTHHSTEDIAIMRSLPNMMVLSPSDNIMVAKFAQMSCKISVPSYIRLDREILPLIYSQDDEFLDGLSCLEAGRDLVIISTGNMVHKALELTKRLKKHSISAGAIDLYRIKPINSELLLKEIGPVKRIITLEEHLITGGLGSAVSEVIHDAGKMLYLKRFAIPDKYYFAYGGRQNLQSICGLDINSVIKIILDWIDKKSY